VINITRRRFLTLTSGLIITGCSASDQASSVRAPTSSPGTTPRPVASSAPSSSGVAGSGETVVTTVTSPDAVIDDDRVLVLVDLQGGNDAVNTLISSSGRYRDLRPSLALGEADVLALPGSTDHGWHPSLAPLLPFVEDGSLATVASIGFSDPDRSHFVSMDRWWRADRTDGSQGWLGRWLDTLAVDEEQAARWPALGATAIGRGSPVLRSETRQATVIDGGGEFTLPAAFDRAAIQTIASEPSDDAVLAAAQRALANASEAVTEFAPIADAALDTSGEPAPDIDTGSAGFATGLAVAAQLVIGEVGTRVVIVSVGGFDTHSEQLGNHAELLADLANGLATFWGTLRAAGKADRVLLATHSEFGRRVAQNASDGCDHGAAGVSFVMGERINAGLYGAIDLDNLLDGDLRPMYDPRDMFTVALDWLGGDVEVILGKRYDGLADVMA
jgi:uncharacterized protein (DUF1501 family)